MMMLGLRRQKQREAELEQRKHVQDRAAIEKRKEAAVELEKSAHAAAAGPGATQFQPAKNTPEVDILAATNAVNAAEVGIAVTEVGTAADELAAAAVVAAADWHIA
jgi:hypothetical protein